jgi:hypothetical protein
MRNIIKQALARRVCVEGSRGRTRIIEVQPSQKLLYGIYFAFAALIALTALEITHIIILQTFNSEIFAAVSLVIGTILGAFFGQKA